MRHCVVRLGNAGRTIWIDIDILRLATKIEANALGVLVRNLDEVRVRPCEANNTRRTRQGV
jgi:hypothetical protein